MARKKAAIAIGIVLFALIVSLYIVPQIYEPTITTGDSEVTELWQYSTDGAIRSSPAISDIDGDIQPEVVVGSDDNTVYALSGEDGSVEWTRRTGDSVSSSPTIADFNDDSISEVIIGGEDGNLYVLSGLDGSISNQRDDDEYSFSDTLSGENDYDMYEIVIDEGASLLHAILDGDSSADFDLFGKLGSEPTTSDYDFRGFASGDENVQIDTPSAGRWYIMVHSYSGSGGYQLDILVAYEEEESMQSYDFTGTLDYEDDTEEYTLSVPEGTTTMQCVLESSGNDFDLYGKLGSSPTTSDYDFRGFASGNEDFAISNPQAGTWYLMVHAYSGSGFFTLEITLTVQRSGTNYLDSPIYNSPSYIQTGEITYNIVVTNELGVISLESDSGSEEWRYDSSGSTTGAAVYDFDEDSIMDVLVGSSGHLYAIDGLNGSILWSHDIGEVLDNVPIVGDIDADGEVEVVIASQEGTVYAYEYAGSEEWAFNTNGNIAAALSCGDIDGDGMHEIVVGSLDSNIYALNAEDGTQLWRYSTGGSIVSSATLADTNGDNRLDVTFGSLDNTLYSLNGRNGSLSWSVTAPDDIVGSPAIADINGDLKLDVVFGCLDGKIYAIEIESSGYRVFWQGLSGDPYFSRTMSLLTVDYDGDLLSIASEFFFGAHWNNNDTDGDLLLDGLEVSIGTSPANIDSDLDGLNDYEEYSVYRTDPTRVDTDSDGLIDSAELIHNTDPRHNDSDSDGLLDGLEVLVYGSDPAQIDSDNDTILDGDEVLLYGSSPASIDTDFDTLLDYDEIFVYNTDPNASDSDSDGLSDIEELTIYETDPVQADSDADGALDGFEINTLGTDPLIFDSDQDNIPDGWEALNGFDPMDSNAPLHEIVLYNAPIYLIIFGALTGIIIFYRLRARKDGIEPEQQDIPEVDYEPLQKKPEIDRVYVPATEGYEKPWLHDDRESLLEEGDLHDFMQWFIHEEKRAEDLIADQQIPDALDLLRELRKYVVGQKDEIFQTNLRAYDRTLTRLEERIRELESMTRR